MSTYYLIPIGGSGSRILRAFIYLCASGCFNKEDQFKVKLIDSDEPNGDLTDMIKAWDLYDKMREKNLALPEIITVSSSSVSGKQWSPLDSMNMDLKEMLSYSSMDAAKRLVDVLFTEDELLNVYEGGFYGHTSVGSYFMEDKILKSDGTYTKEWSEFFEGHKPGDKVFIFGSVFGGTGASGVPTLSRIIKENNAKDGTADMIVGSEFIMPYFRTVELDSDGENRLSIDWTTFSAKTKTALNFYRDQKYDESIFDALYFIGEDPDDFMNVPNEIQGDKQQNKPNHIELLAATAIISFFKNDYDEFTLNLLGAPDRELSADYMNGIFEKEIVKNGVARNLENMFIFSIIYSKYIYYCIEDEYASDWKYDKKVLDKTTNKTVYDFCMKYIDWMRKMSLSTDDAGRISIVPDKKFKLINVAEKYDTFFDGTNIEYHEDGFLKFKHKKYDLDQFNGVENILLSRKINSPKNIILEKFSKMKNESWEMLIANLLEAID